MAKRKRGRLGEAGTLIFRIQMIDADIYEFSRRSFAYRRVLTEGQGECSFEGQGRRTEDKKALASL